MSRYLPDLGYPTFSWPTTADREHYYARALKEFPRASAEKLEEAAQAFADCDRRTRCLVEVQFTKAVPHPVHGFAILDNEDLAA